MALCEEVLWWHAATYNQHITMADIKSRSRLAPIVQARGDCMRRLRFDKGWTYPRIGRYFGLDHTTVQHHIKRPNWATKPIKNSEHLSLEELKAKQVYDRYRKQKYETARVGEFQQPAGESHENP